MMKKTVSLALLLVVSVAAVSQGAIVTKTITSANFNIGLGKQAASPEAWTENGLTVGPGPGYTLSVSVTSGYFSSAGPTFPGSVLTTGSDLDDFVGSQENFLATITATATTQADAALLPNYLTSLHLTRLSVWAAGYSSYPGTDIGWTETTVGHTGSSDLLADLNSSGGNPYVEDAGSYKQLIWDISDADPLDAYQVAGLSVTRTFELVPALNGFNYRMIDGFEVLGNISLSYDIAIAPEPSSGLMAMLAAGALACARRRKRAK